MNNRPALFWEIVSVAGMREPGRLKAVASALDSVRELAPTLVGRSWPARRQLKGSVASTLGAYEGRLDPNQPEMWFMARREPPEGTLDIYLADEGRLDRGMPHRLTGKFSEGGWFDSPDRLRMLGVYLSRVADAAGAFYAYCTSDGLLDQRLRLLQRNAGAIFGAILKAGRAAEDLNRELPDVFWWNYFGPAFVRRWNGRLDGLGVHQEVTPTAARVVWATETPFVLDPRAKRLDGYAWKQQFYAALGEDTFMHEGQKQRLVGEVVPDLNEHRHTAGGEPVVSTRGGEASSRPMPTVIDSRDAAPAAAVDEAEAEIIESAGLLVHLYGEKPPTLDEISRWLRLRQGIAARDNLSRGAVIVYRNPDTAVMAGFEVEEPADLSPRLPAGLQAAGLGFRLPWLKPSFVAREAVPVLVELVDHFKLMVATDIPNGQKLEPMLVSETALIELWNAGNVEAIRSAPSPIPYMRPGRSDRWWLYQSQKAQLHRQLGEDVFVPTLVAIAPGRRTDDLLLHITWTDGIPLVLPECDLVTLLDGRHPSEFKIRGSVPYSEVRKALDPYLDSVKIEGLGAVPMLKPDRAGQARPAFLRLPTHPVDHVEVGPAGWVDVRIDDRPR
jgi:hypothetical protein